MISKRQKFYLFFKRAMDLIVSFFAILILFASLIYPVVFIIEVIDHKGKAIFKQNRIGKNSKVFSILKFRTMNINAPSEVASEELLNPTQYYTKFGRILRKTHLDELPQIFNIFVGQMSFVGPRPALWNQFELIKKRNNVGVNSIRPGLTGYAQIDTSHVLSIDEKVEKDLYYLEHLSFSMDVKVFFETFSSIARVTRKK